MLTRFHSSGAEPVRTATVAAGIVALAMLLAVPVLRARHFNQSIRPSQALAQIQRHIFVAQPEAGPVVLVPNYGVRSALLADLDGAHEIKPIASFESAWVPLPRLLVRLKIGSSRRSASDPLL